KRVNGKRPLLRKLIANFGDTFADAVPTLRKQIADGSLVEARRLAHTLKGVAASLEIGAVAAAAADIETRLAADDLAGLDERLAQVNLVLTPALAACASLTRPAAAIAAAVNTTADMAAIRAELRVLLERRSLNARAVFDH